MQASSIGLAFAYNTNTVIEVVDDVEVERVVYTFLWGCGVAIPGCLMVRSSSWSYAKLYPKMKLFDDLCQRL